MNSFALCFRINIPVVALLLYEDSLKWKNIAEASDISIEQNFMTVTWIDFHSIALICLRCICSHAEVMPRSTLREGAKANIALIFGWG